MRLATCDATGLFSCEACPSTDKQGCADNASVQHVMLQAFSPVKHALQRTNMVVQTMRLCSM